MFNKVIIGMLVFLLILTGIVCAYVFNLTQEIGAMGEQLVVSQEEISALGEQLTVSQEEIDALGEQLSASEKERAAQISALSGELATFRGETLARIGTLDGELRGVATELEQSVINAVELYQEVSKGVVQISDGEKTVGSGFVFGTDGHILTPQHVAEGLAQINVILPDGSTSTAAIVGSCRHSDVAVLKLEQSLTAEALTLADSTTVRVGEPAVVIGNPFDLPLTVTSGIVSQTCRFIDVKYDSKARWVANLIQFDAAVNPGNSGSPLLNSRGEVIGMVIARVDPTRGEGVYYAVSSNKVKRVALSLIEQGSFDYPWLGIEMVDLVPETVRARDLETANGALVKKIIAGSPADVAGIDVDDIIVAIDEVTVREVADLTCYLGEYKSPDEVVALELIRGREKLTLSVKLGKR